MRWSIVVLLSFALAAWADGEDPPLRHTVASPDGKRSVEVVPAKLNRVPRGGSAPCTKNFGDLSTPCPQEAPPPEPKTQLTMIDVDAEDALWTVQTELPDPGVMVANGGHYVAAWEPHGHEPDTVMLEVFGARGNRVGRYRLKDLFSPKELKRVPRSTSKTLWGKPERFDYAKKTLVLQLYQSSVGRGPKRQLDLRTGKVLP